MKFSLVLQCSNKKLNVLNAETPKSGGEFLMYASACLRRSLDDINRYRHQTLGALASYTMSVPQQIALGSGHFNDTATVVISVSEDILKSFIFYGASLTSANTNRPCYPYTTNEVVLTSYIDELAFIFAWQAAGFPLKVKLGPGGSLIPDNSSDEEDNKKPGQGCNGCPVGPVPPYGPDGRPAGWPAPPQKPYYRPGPNTPYVPQPPYPPAPPAPTPSGGGAVRPTVVNQTASTTGIAPGTIMIGEDMLSDSQFNALFDDVP